MSRADPSPRIHALMLVRDEADIIHQSLDHLLTWAAGLYILDTGSTDGTWDIINDRARRDPRMLFAHRTSELFHSALRAALFQTHRRRFARRDWVARVDADEFYHIDPRAFIRHHVRPFEGRVAVWQYLFLMTRAEARAWRAAHPSHPERDQPIEQRRRFYLPHPYPEVRFYRYRPTMRWFPDRPDPANPGPMALERIPVRHYRFRDPPQIRARIRLRSHIASQTQRVGRHWEAHAVRVCLADDADPNLRHWPAQTPLIPPDHWPDPDAHLRVTPTGRLGHACHRAGLAWLLDLAAR